MVTDGPNDRALHHMNSVKKKQQVDFALGCMIVCADGMKDKASQHVTGDSCALQPMCLQNCVITADGLDDKSFYHMNSHRKTTLGKKKPCHAAAD